MGGVDKPGAKLDEKVENPTAKVVNQAENFTLDRTDFRDDTALKLATTTEEKPAGKLQTKYKEKSQEYLKHLKDDRGKLSKSVENVRYNLRLLVSKPGEENKILPKEQQFDDIKEETNRRISAYTKAFEKGWYTLDYLSLGTDDAGFSHEYHVGLGDILLDPDITRIQVLKEDGSLVNGRRGKTSRGRVCFLDDNGSYLATFTNEKFRILDDNETDKNNAPNLGTYVQNFDQETTERKTHQKDEFTQEKEARTYFDDTGGGEYVVDLDPKAGSVVDQMKKRLSSSQRENANIIEEEFRTALGGILPEPALSNAVGAGIVNAIAEAGLKAGIIGDGGNSVGLFQLHIRGAGHGMTVAERQDPRINTRTILNREVLKKAGRNFLNAAKSGASIGELAGIFSRDIERPADKVGAMNRRQRMAYSLFGHKVKGAPIESSERMLVYQITTPEGLTGTMRFKKGQDTWILGSSTVYGMKEFVGSNSGLCGIIGANPESFLRNFQNIVLPKLKAAGIKPPSKVILVGMAVNGINPKANSKKTATNVMDDYLQIVQFLKENGVKDVKITTATPHKARQTGITAFNNLLKTKYSEYCLDTASKFTSPDGKWLTGMSTDDLHLTAEGKRILAQELGNMQPSKIPEKPTGQYFTKIEWGKRKRPGICDLKSGQDTWIFGSSIANMMFGNTVGKTGVYGIGALDAPRFLQDLEGRWEEIARTGVTPPKQVILLGLSMNGLRNKSGNPQSIARKEIAENMKIVNFLKSKGVTNVKIALEHSYSKNLGPIIAYNNLLKSEYPDQSVDYLHAVDSPKMHFSSQESRRLAKYFDNLKTNERQTS